MDYMKLDTVLQAQESRTLRNFEGRYKRAARRLGEQGGRGSNFPKKSLSREAAYKQRMELRIASRYLHLARAFLKGTPYFDVEAGVRLGNEPSAHMVALILSAYNVDVPVCYIENWLEVA